MVIQQQPQLQIFTSSAGQPMVMQPIQQPVQPQYYYPQQQTQFVSTQGPQPPQYDSRHYQMVAEVTPKANTTVSYSTEQAPNFTHTVGLAGPTEDYPQPVPPPSYTKNDD